MHIYNQQSSGEKGVAFINTIFNWFIVSDIYWVVCLVCLFVIISLFVCLFF